MMLCQSDRLSDNVTDDDVEPETLDGKTHSLVRDQFLAAHDYALDRVMAMGYQDPDTNPPPPWFKFASSPALVLRVLQRRIGTYLLRASEARTYLLQGVYDLSLDTTQLVCAIH